MTEPLNIEIYPMADGNLANFRSEITSWDILVRPDGGDPIEEIEDLIDEEARDKALSFLEAKYPDAAVDWSISESLE